MKGVFKIGPDGESAVRPYRTRAEALQILMQTLAKTEKIDVFYCGRAGNSCARVELPVPAK